MNPPTQQAREPSDAPSPDGAGLGRAVDPAASVTRVLAECGQVDARALERAARVAADSGRRMDAVMLQLGLVTERDLAGAYAEALGLALAGPERYPVMPLPEAEALPARFLRYDRVLPVAMEHGVLVLACVDPLDPFAAAAAAAATGHPVRAEVAVPIELEAALDRLYPADGAGPDEAAGDDAPREDDAERLKDLASEAPVIRLVNALIARAVESRASDIHVEPFEDRLRVRYRHDGVLREADSPPLHLAAAVTSRIKIMARLDIAERRLPQDGRIKLAVRGQEIDLRVSTVPSLYGETVVLRVLDRGAVTLDFERLGLAPAVVSGFAAATRQPEGIVLVTGPTGSGKTTTLYTGLLALNDVGRKIITLEDPIEYQLHGINQVQVKPQIGLEFASLLRSLLRQDPDVIMVGEIRDLETARVATQTALTGHLVLSTLHTNSAAASVTRLRDMGLEDYLINAVLRGVLAQRLVRRLCPDCRREEEAPPSMVEHFRLDRRVPPGQPLRLWRPVGCANCRDSGYRGRQAIAEFLKPDAEIKRLVFNRADHAEIERAAVTAGMRTMFETGLDAALAGETTVEEVVRSVRSES